MTDSQWIAPDYKILYYEYNPNSRAIRDHLPAWVREQIHFRHTKHGLTISEVVEEYGISRTSARSICSGLHVRNASWINTLPMRLLKEIPDGAVSYTGLN